MTRRLLVIPVDTYGGTNSSSSTANQWMALCLVLAAVHAASSPRPEPHIFSRLQPCPLLTPRLLRCHPATRCSVSCCCLAESCRRPLAATRALGSWAGAGLHPAPRQAASRANETCIHQPSWPAEYALHTRSHCLLRIHTSVIQPISRSLLSFGVLTDHHASLHYNKGSISNLTHSALTHLLRWCSSFFGAWSLPLCAVSWPLVLGDPDSRSSVVQLSCPSDCEPAVCFWLCSFPLWAVAGGCCVDAGGVPLWPF